MVKPNKTYASSFMCLEDFRSISCISFMERDVHLDLQLYVLQWNQYIYNTASFEPYRISPIIKQSCMGHGASWLVMVNWNWILGLQTCSGVCGIPEHKSVYIPCKDIRNKSWVLIDLHDHHLSILKLTISSLPIVYQYPSTNRMTMIPILPLILPWIYGVQR